MKFGMKSALVFLALFLGLTAAAEARFTFSVVPDRGGRDVRFTPAKPGQAVRNEEVTVTVSNDEGRRYRIIQQQMSPFVNERGQTLSAGSVKIFSPSAPAGRLGVVFPTALNPGQTVIFDSDNTGTAESFSLVFALQTSPSEAAGTFRSELIYQLESVEGGAAPVTAVLPVQVEVRPDFFLDVKNVKGGGALDLGRISRQRGQGTAALEIRVGAGIGSRYRVYQRLLDNITGSQGQFLDEDKISFAGSRADTGRSVTQEQSLSSAKKLIFESDDVGSAAAFAVEYRSGDLSSQTAGIYRSNVEFSVESDGSAMFVPPVTLPLQIEIETLYYLEVEYDSAGGLNFGKFKNEGDAQTRRVHITTHNNTGQPYQVIQRVGRLFTNETGKVLPSQNFTAVMEGAQNGSMALMNAQPVRAGDTALYTSNTRGSSDAFDVEYTLTLPRDTSGGEYTSETTYSLSALS